MRALGIVIFAGITLIYASASNAFFIFFPIPRVGGAVAGNICVAAGKKAGETFRSTNGNVATIREIFGESPGCKNPDLPQAARVDFEMLSSFSSQAGMNLPDGYKILNLSDLNRFNGVILLAQNSAIDGWIQVIAIKRDAVVDAQTHASSIKANQAKSLDDVEQSEIEQLVINGLRAWRFESTGNLRGRWGHRYGYVTTVLEGAGEVVVILSWTNIRNLFQEKAGLRQLAFGLVGVSAPPSPSRKEEGALKTTVLPLTNSTTTQTNAPVTSTNSGVGQPESGPSALVPKPKAEVRQDAEAVDDGRRAGDRLRDLDKLRREGIITQKEFDEKKKEILKSM